MKKLIDLIRVDRKEHGDEKADPMYMHDSDTGITKYVPEGTEIMPSPNGSDQPQPPWAKAEAVVDMDIYGRWMASVRERLPKNIRWGDDINAMVSIAGRNLVKVKWKATTPAGIAYLNSLGNTLGNLGLPAPDPELPETVPCKDFPNECSQPFHPPKQIAPTFVDAEECKETTLDIMNEIDKVRGPKFFYVLNRERLLEYEESKPHLVIAISDPTVKTHQLRDNPNRLGELLLSFWDLDKKTPSIPEGYFTSAMARSILTFIGCYGKAEVVYCACEAGISRSAGVAAALAKIYTGCDSEYFKRYVPNRRVYLMILAEHYNA